MDKNKLMEMCKNNESDKMKALINTALLMADFEADTHMKGADSGTMKVFKNDGWTEIYRDQMNAKYRMDK